MKRFILAILAAIMVAAPVATVTADTFTAAELSKAQTLVYEVPATQKAMRDYVYRMMTWLNGLSSAISTLGPITVAPTSALTNAVILTDSDIGNAINVGDNPIIGTAFKVNATTSAQMNVSAAASTWSGIDVAADADAEDVMLRTTGSEGDILLVSADDVSVDVAANGIISIGDNAVLKRINIGGNSTDGNDAVYISTDANTADSINIGNVAIASTLVLEGGTAATAIQIGNGGTAHGIQIGSNAAAAQAIVVGSANAASTLDLTSGTAWSMTGAGYLSQTPVAVTDTVPADSVACAANWCVVTTKSLTTAAGDCYSIAVTNANVIATTGVVATMTLYGGAGFPLVRMATPGGGSTSVQICNLHAANALNAAVTFTLHVGD